MKKLLPLLGTFLIVVVAVSCNRPHDWTLYEGNGCSALFPDKPTGDIQTVNTAIGELKMDIHQYEVPKLVIDDNLTYGLIESEYPDSLINSDKKDILERFFRGSLDGAVNNVHGKLLSEKPIEIDGFPGREARIDFRNGLAVVTMREYLVKNKLYILQTITETKKDLNKSIAKFMGSFKLKHGAELKPVK